MKNARKRPLPEWYLPEGTINASDNQLEAASSSCERWGMWFAVVVVIAVLAELLIAWIEPPYLKFLTDSAIADAAVAIGIVGEVALGTMWNNHIQTELRKRSDTKVATAFDRATAAENKLIWLLTPRRVQLAPHADRIVSELKAFPDTKFDIGFGSGDGEQADFAWDIEEMLGNAGWNQQQWGAIAGGPAVVNDRGRWRPFAGSVSAINVEIHIDPDSRKKLLAAADAFISILNDIGIEAKHVPFNTRNANADAIHILIGPKA